MESELANLQKAEPPILTDWFAISIRWLFLLGCAVCLANDQIPHWYLALVFGAGSLWNTAASVLAVLRRRLPAHRLIFTAGDFLLCFILFISGGEANLLWWSGLLCIITSAIYFEWRGCVLFALLTTFIQASYSFWTAGQLLTVNHGQTAAAANLLAGIILAFTSGKLHILLRSLYIRLANQYSEDNFWLFADTRARHSRMYRMMDELSSVSRYRKAFEITLNLCWATLGENQEETGGLRGAILIFNADGILMVEASRHFTPTDQKALFPAREGALAKAVQTAKTQTIQNPGEDPELRRVVALISCQSGVILPLTDDHEVYGVILLAHSEKMSIEPDSFQKFEVIRQQAANAIQNAIYLRDVEKEKDRIIENQERARREMVQELYDGPVQAVASIASRANLARSIFQKDPTAVPQELAKIEDQARRTNQEMRHLLLTVPPLVLETKGLEAALKDLAKDFWERREQQVEIEVDAKAAAVLKPEKLAVVYSLIKEAVQNANRYSGASVIRVRMHRVTTDDNLVLLQIMDNGIGFDLARINKKYPAPDSPEMVNLQERAALLYGLLTIETDLGKGTRLQVAIPITTGANERMRRGIAEPDTG